MPEPIQNPDVILGARQIPNPRDVSVQADTESEFTRLPRGVSFNKDLATRPTMDSGLGLRAGVLPPEHSVIDSDTGRVAKPEDYLIQIPGVPKPLHLPANASKKEVEDLSQELHALWNAKGR